MCGIFGAISTGAKQRKVVKTLALHARQRGRDSSGLLYFSRGRYQVSRADYDIKKLLAKTDLRESSLVVGHSRLITNGLSENQPVVRDGIALFHNGIIVNPEQVWARLKTPRKNGNRQRGHRGGRLGSSSGRGLLGKTAVGGLAHVPGHCQLRPADSATGQTSVVFKQREPFCGGSKNRKRGEDSEQRQCV